MPKASKYSSPEWKANPVLAQVREALAETEHIRKALKKLETQAMSSGGDPNRKWVANLMASGQLGNWLVSLNESFVGLNYLTVGLERGGISNADRIASAWLMREIANADRKWALRKQIS